MKHSVLITGASTGIGRSIAIFLAQTGHQVFAGVRKVADGVNLKAEESSVTPVVIDVTSSESIVQCLQEVSKLRDSARPFTLINNAGIVVPGPVEALKLAELRKQFDVNFFGLVETTQAFLPIIRETRGKIVNVSSISGRVSSPFLSAYSSSKFALEALSDSLRQELAPFGVKVVLVEPGPIQSEIWNKGFENKDRPEVYCNPDRFMIYENRMKRFQKIVSFIAETSIPAINVSRKVAKAIESSNPPIRIIVAALRSRVEMQTGMWLPARIYDKLVAKVLKA